MPTWELPREHSPHQAVPKWQLLGQSESPSMEKSAHHTFDLWFNTAAWTWDRKLCTSGNKLLRESLVMAGTHRMLEITAKNEAMYSSLHHPHLERVFSQKLNHIRIDVLGFLAMFIQPWSTPLRMLIHSSSSMCRRHSLTPIPLPYSLSCTRRTACSEPTR